MNREQLAAMVERPEVHRLIMGSYQGAYSLGLTSDPADTGGAAIRVRIEGEDASGIPDKVLIQGEPVRVLVSTRFSAPKPLPLEVYGGS